MLYGLGPRARRVYQQLLDGVASGEFAAGSRLPSHIRLAETFGVAPLTMRQVLARLEADRLVAREPGRGTFVRAADGPQVLIVASQPGDLSTLLDQVRHAGHRAILAATPAEGLAALDRELLISLVVVDLRLPIAQRGLAFARAARRRNPGLPLAVVNVTRRQRSRLQHSVAPPLLIVSDPELDQFAHILRAALDQVSSDSGSEAAAKQRRLEDLLHRYLDVQLAGERAAARALILREGIAAGLSTADVYMGVLQPAQYQIGELWQANQISVAREHLATAITESVALDVNASAPRASSNGIRVLVACVQGELHDIGARMTADLLELDGFVVRFLGADVPTESLVAMIREEMPRLVVLSAATPERVVQLREAVASARRACGGDLRIFVGGQIMHAASKLVDALEVDLAAHDALETVAGARRMLTTGI